MIEIRTYHFDPKYLSAFKDWVRDEAAPFLRSKVNLVGFWINNDVPPELSGVEPEQYPHSNVTWILKWDSKEERDRVHSEVFRGKLWQGIWEKHPNPKAYLRMEVKFADDYK